MTELISFSSQVFGNESMNAVNARDVWEFVESQQQFADWIKNRLRDFEESVDFTPFVKNMKGEFRLNVGFSLKEYYLTIECAKHICLIERNAKGKELRQNLIECEKKLLSPQFHLPTNFKEALLLLAVAEDDKEQLALERDIAIKTKHQISDSKTASAMNKASVLSKKNKKLEAALPLYEKLGDLSEGEILVIKRHREDCEEREAFFDKRCVRGCKD